MSPQNTVTSGSKQIWERKKWRGKKKKTTRVEELAACVAQGVRGPGQAGGGDEGEVLGAGEAGREVPRGHQAHQRQGQETGAQPRAGEEKGEVGSPSLVWVGRGGEGWVGTDMLMHAPHTRVYPHGTHAYKQTCFCLHCMYGFSASHVPITSLFPLSVHCPSVCDEWAAEMINYGGGEGGGLK